jgi:hypothetical protein
MNKLSSSTLGNTKLGLSTPNTSNIGSSTLINSNLNLSPPTTSKLGLSNPLDFNKLLNNEMLLPLLGVAITLYSVMVVPKLNIKNLELLDNMGVKLALVALVYYLSTINKMYGVILAVGILFSVLGYKATNKQNATATVNVVSTNPVNVVPTNLNVSTTQVNNVNPTPTQDNAIVLSPVRTEIIQKAYNKRKGFSELLEKANDNDDVLHIKTGITIQDHIIDSALNEKSHLQLMNLTPTPGPTNNNVEFHKNNAELYKTKLQSLLNSEMLREELNNEATLYNKEKLNELLLLLNHENNKIDLVSNIQNELSQGIQALEHDKGKATEHFDNVDNYNIELAEKLRLYNVEHIKKYYDNLNDAELHRQSNDYTDVEPDLEETYQVAPYEP